MSMKDYCDIGSSMTPAEVAALQSESKCSKKNKKFVMTALEDENDNDDAPKLSKEKEDQKCQP